MIQLICGALFRPNLVLFLILARINRKQVVKDVSTRFYLLEAVKMVEDTDLDLYVSCSF
jgi:F0F1-type ATP synthase assembly protein I